MAEKVNKTIVLGGVDKLVRFSYAHVFEPHAARPDIPEKYSVMLLIDKNDTTSVTLIKEAINEVAKRACAQGMWGGKIPNNFNSPLKDGDTDAPEKANPKDFEGMYFCNASGKYKPGIIDRNLQPIIDPETFYSGCYGRAQVNLFPYDSIGNKGISVGLNNLQKVKDGPSLMGRQNPEDAFKDFDNSKFETSVDDLAPEMDGLLY